MSDDMATLDSLPDCLLIFILQLAYQHAWVQSSVNPLRTVAPLVCRRWRAVLRSPAAAELLYNRIRITEPCVLPAPRLDPRRLVDWFAGKSFVVKEFEVELTPALGDAALLLKLSGAVGQVLSQCTNLQVLRLTGQLQLGPLGDPLAPALGRMHQLSSVYLAGGGEEWGVAGCVRQLQGLPRLRELQIKFASEADPPPTLPAVICDLPELEHLSLAYPFPGAMPPTYDLPAELAGLTRMTTLALKWVPAQQAPKWLGTLTRLQHLLYDPYLPADVPSLLPQGVSALTALRTLVVPRRLSAPDPIPTTLTNLETLHMHGPGYSMALDQDWEWVGLFKRLRSLRLQSAGLRELPEGLCRLSQLTRLELMCNQLQDLQPGAYLDSVQVLHLGNNNVVAFPPALRSARALRVLYLANQRADLDVRNVAAKLAMTKDDVAALAGMHRTLRTLVLGLAQPQIVVLAAAAAGAPRQQRQQAAPAVQPQPPSPLPCPQQWPQETPRSQQGSTPSPFAAAAPQAALGVAIACSSDEESCGVPGAAAAAEASTADGPSRGQVQLARPPACGAEQGKLVTAPAVPPSSAPSLLDLTPVPQQPQPAARQVPGGSHAAASLGARQGPPAMAAPMVVGFDWLQRVLRKRGIKVTANELAYEFEKLDIFDVKHLHGAPPPPGA